LSVYEQSLPDSSLRRRIRMKLLRWFDRERRDLPWRRDRDPYRIWVSEVMLQQTQVATVLRYYEPFLQLFPRLGDLAKADERQVLRRWQGLGYYRRARHLHAAARLVVTRHGGKVPDDPETFGALPGVGRYVKGAVLSQAYGSRLPIVDSNSERVVCRLLGQKDNPRRGPVRRWLWDATETLLPSKRVGDFNQALMELGALVCTRSKPHCQRCPLKTECAARRLGLQDVVPVRSATPRIIETREVALILRHGSKVLLVQCPDAGRWAGMWEFPRLEVASRESIENAIRRLLGELDTIRARLGREFLRVRHAVTRHRITIVCFEAQYVSGRFSPMRYREGRWVKFDQIGDYPLATPQRCIAREARKTRDG
jgi:A/G-specific adenine glycosylase